MNKLVEHEIVISAVKFDFSKARKILLDNFSTPEKCIDVVKELIKKYYLSIHARNGLLFRWASENGHYYFAKWLLQNYPIDIHLMDEYPLRWAARNGQLEVVKWLVRYCGADVTTNHSECFYWACKYGHLPVVKWLARKTKVDIHGMGERALRAAHQYKKTEVVDWLINRRDANPIAIGYSPDEELSHAERKINRKLKREIKTLKQKEAEFIQACESGDLLLMDELVDQVSMDNCYHDGFENAKEAGPMAATWFLQDEERCKRTLLVANLHLHNRWPSGQIERYSQEVMMATFGHFAIRYISGRFYFLSDSNQEMNNFSQHYSQGTWVSNSSELEIDGAIEAYYVVTIEDLTIHSRGWYVC